MFFVGDRVLTGEVLSSSFDLFSVARISMGAGLAALLLGSINKYITQQGDEESDFSYGKWVDGFSVSFTTF